MRRASITGRHCRNKAVTPRCLCGAALLDCRCRAVARRHLPEDSVMSKGMDKKKEVKKKPAKTVKEKKEAKAVKKAKQDR
jgi:hypothetical protein